MYTLNDYDYTTIVTGTVVVGGGAKHSILLLPPPPPDRYIVRWQMPVAYSPYLSLFNTIQIRFLPSNLKPYGIHRLPKKKNCSERATETGLVLVLYIKDLTTKPLLYKNEILVSIIIGTGEICDVYF